MLETPQFLNTLAAEHEHLVTVSITLHSDACARFKRKIGEAFESSSYSDWPNILNLSGLGADDAATDFGQELPETNPTSPPPTTCPTPPKLYDGSTLGSCVVDKFSNTTRSPLLVYMSLISRVPKLFVGLPWVPLDLTE